MFHTVVTMFLDLLSYSIKLRQIRARFHTNPLDKLTENVSDSDFRIS